MLHSVENRRMEFLRTTGKVRFADNQGIECLREVPGSYDSPSGELGHTLTIDNR
jgi:hypothetical protein